MRLRITIITCLLLGVACQNDNREVLFDMVFPNILFDIPAGLPAGAIPQVLDFDNFASNIDEYLRENNLTLEQIDAIHPNVANMRAINNDGDYDFLGGISIRMCPRNTESCREAEEVFYLEGRDLYRRAGSSVELLPTLINAKRQLQEDRLKLEIWLFLNEVSPTSIRTRLDLQFEAVRER
jgi:hypothetical protein